MKVLQDTLKEANDIFKINKKEENQDIVEYQNTKDEKILQKVYDRRLPSLNYWANHFYYLADSSCEDMVSELRVKFFQAVLTYEKGKGHFNSWLYTLILNCLKNLLIKKKAKKRRPAHMENTIHDFVLSLNEKRSNSDGEKNTLMDTISDTPSEKETHYGLSFEETLNTISHKNKVIHGYFKRISNGETLSELIKEKNIIEGYVPVKKTQMSKIKSKRDVSKLIKSYEKISDDFKILEYKKCSATKVEYTIEMKENKNIDLLLGHIKKMRKNENYYKSHMV